MLVIVVLLATRAAVAQPAGLFPAYLIQLPRSVTTVLVAETDTSMLHRYENGENGIVFHDSGYMSIGQNGVGKRQAWDRRTPLGIYFVNERLDTSGLHEKYGPMAFPLDYPNVWDRIKKRAGDGIWIHGVAANSERRPPLDTDGCIAVPNEALMILEGALRPMITPVIITRDVNWVSADEISAIRKELKITLDAWARSFRSGDLYGYLSLYAEDFEFRGMDRSEWTAYRVQSIAATPIRGFSIDDLLLLGDPEEEGFYLSRFRQTIIDEANTVVTIKRLYWRRSTDGELRIVAEDNG